MKKRYFAVQKMVAEKWVTVSMVYFETGAEAQVAAEEHERKQPGEMYRWVEVGGEETK